VIEDVELQRVQHIEPGLVYPGESGGVVEGHLLLVAARVGPRLVRVVHVEAAVVVLVCEYGMPARAPGTVVIAGLQAHQLRLSGNEHAMYDAQPGLLGGGVAPLLGGHGPPYSLHAHLHAGGQFDGRGVISPFVQISLAVLLIEPSSGALLVGVIPLGVADHAQAQASALQVRAVVADVPSIGRRAEPGVHGEA